MRNKFGVGQVGNKIAIVNEIPERIGPEDALNLAAYLAFCALAAKGGDVQANLERFMRDVADAAEDNEIGDKIRAELKS